MPVRTRDDVVWNTDARNKPELEVEIELVLAPADVPGVMARVDATLEVEIDVCEIIDEDLIYNTPPRGYADAYAMAI